MAGKRSDAAAQDTIGPSSSSAGQAKSNESKLTPLTSKETSPRAVRSKLAICRMQRPKHSQIYPPPGPPFSHAQNYKTTPDTSSMRSYFKQALPQTSDTAFFPTAE